MSSTRANRLIMAYQPVVSFANGSIVGHEALLRVVGPDGALRSPAETIRRAEARKRTLALDTRVADLVAADLATGSQLGTVHLNVSAATAQDHGPEMVDHLAAWPRPSRAAGCQPRRSSSRSPRPSR